MRAAEFRVRSARARPAEPRELLEQLAASEDVRPRAVQHLVQHDEADRLEQVAADMCGSDDISSKDAAMWDAWLCLYSAHCSRHGGPDREAMAAANPVFVPRPSLVDDVSVAASSGDFEPAQRLLDMLPHAFNEAQLWEKSSRRRMTA